MKRLLCICLLVCMLTGCREKVGSFLDGDINFNVLFDRISQKKAQKDWELPLLNDQDVSLAVVEEEYQLDMTKIDECVVRRSIIPAELGEIAFFKTAESNDALLKEAVEVYKGSLKEQWKYIKNSVEVIEKAVDGRIGEYYYFILGEDHEKVVDYMQSIDD